MLRSLREKMEMRTEMRAPARRWVMQLARRGSAAVCLCTWSFCVENVRVGVPEVLKKVGGQRDEIVALFENVLGQLQSGLHPALTHEQIHTVIFFIMREILLWWVGVYTESPCPPRWWSWCRPRRCWIRSLQALGSETAVSFLQAPEV